MIDSVLKGTGNSRFLKSAVPAGTSWADALAMLQAGTFPIDFNGINTDGFQQVGTPLNKANLLKDATAAQIGLPPSTTPDGMFQALGNTGELHVWRKTVTTAQEIPAGYKLGDAESGTAFSVPNSGSQNYVTLQYGPSITVNDGGGVSLTSVTGSVQFKQYSDVSAIYDIRNNFVKAIPNGSGTSAFDGVIFVPNDCSFKNTAGIVTFGKFYRVNAYPLTPAGTTTTYPVSTNPNAYQEGDDAKEAGYTLGEVVTGMFRINAVYNNTTIYYASSVNVADNGAVTLANQATQGLAAEEDSYNNAKKLAGKFIIADYNHNYCKIPKGVVLFIPANTTISFRQDVPGDEGYGIFFDRYQPVTGYAAIPAGTTIEYLGKLGDKARVQVVSYVGTGTYGDGNQCSITANFKIKSAIMMYHYMPSAGSIFMIPDELSTGYTSDIGFSEVNANYSWAKKSADGKTLFWYGTRSASGQFNESGRTYYVLCIG